MDGESKNKASIEIEYRTDRDVLAAVLCVAAGIVIGSATTLVVLGYAGIVP